MSFFSSLNRIILNRQPTIANTTLQLFQKATATKPPLSTSSSRISIASLSSLSSAATKPVQVPVLEGRVDEIVKIHPNIPQIQHIQQQTQYVKELISSIENSLGRDIPLVGYQVMNRNARRPKGPNKGKRPCSRIGRRAKRSKYGNPRRK